MDKERGFMNEDTGQTLLVRKKEFGMHYVVLLFTGGVKVEGEGKTVSPEFETEAKAEAFALDWMNKNPNGTS